MTIPASRLSAGMAAALMLGMGGGMDPNIYMNMRSEPYRNKRPLTKMELAAQKKRQKAKAKKSEQRKARKIQRKGQ